ncbi:response regulator transcription factor [Pelagicoccus mobilis]|uniref:Response regulator n=1 Tax=Pelagicoccus mobilis TaxID=415221 RepID=A0A934VTT2_9BACT|nr:response regulator [Pelagicoccus mobilis]MBK1879829.1 response regulator [Pelagicoccus mobilis]
MQTPLDLSGFQHRNVLIIDDEPSIHHLFTTFLHPEEYSSDASKQKEDDNPVYNFEVHNAFNGEYGLDICAKQAEKEDPIQIAFVDMRMNGWDGVETIQNLHKHDPRINFVIVTGFPEIAQAQADKRLDEDTKLKILPKPTTIGDIYQTAYNLTERWNQLYAAN